MTYSPLRDRDIRVRYDSNEAGFMVEQRLLRKAHGTTNPNDLGSILDLGQEVWELRAYWPDPKDALYTAFKIAFEERAYIRSIDLGPVSGVGLEVAAARDFLSSVTL